MRFAFAQQPLYAAVSLGTLDSASEATIAREIARATARGLPAEPLIAKVREGRLKRAAGTRIQLAVTSLAVRLDSARAALGVGATSAELIAAADALNAGAHPAALRALRDAAFVRPITVPIGTLAQLIASGVPQQRAVDAIVALLKRRATPAQLLALGNQVELDVNSGLRPEESAAFRLRGIEAGSLGDKVTVQGGNAVGATPTSGTPTPPRPAAPPPRRTP
ncbi:MAG: hypothetical protein H0W68_11705 [Gemmatimonadaceae bacterium]|nr:hypothetical protein [Gemmatimonadaceae bacterium]